MELALSSKRDVTFFRSWVPKWLAVTILFLLLFPTMFVNGAYSSTAGEMTAGLGIISEHIQFSNFLSAVGMAVLSPFLIPYMRIRRPKMVFQISFLLLFFLSWVCAKTAYMPLLFLCSFFMGLLRITLIFNAIITLVEYLTGMDILGFFLEYNPDETPEETAKKNRLKSLGLPVLYIFFVSLGQIGSAVTAWFAYEYEWQYVYGAICVLILIALLLISVTMRYMPKRKNVKIDFSYFGDIIAAAISLASISYILVYGKTLDWFDDFTIRLAGAVFLISTSVLLFLVTNTRKPYFDLNVFKSKKVVTALLFFTLFMIINSSSMLVNAFTAVSMKLDNYQSASLGNWALVGYLIGGAMSVVMTYKRVPFKYMFATGFGLITVSAVYLYFQYQSMGMYGNMIFPVITRATGMLMLYALLGTFGMIGLRSDKFLGTWLFLMLAIRSVIAPVAGTSLYSNALNQRTQHYIVRLSQDVDRMNPEVAATYDGTRMGMMMQGKSYEQAEQMAAISTKGRVQVQATLVALKEITGWTIFAGIGCTLLALFFPYEERKKKIHIIQGSGIASVVPAP